MNKIPDDLKQFYINNYHNKGKGLVHIDIENNLPRYYFYSLNEIVLSSRLCIDNYLSTIKLLYLLDKYNDKEEIVISYFNQDNNIIITKIKASL